MAAHRRSEPARPTGPEDAPHDILAAEEFVVPATDPRLHEEHENPPHDVLAAEEFVVPASELHPGPVTLPDDPTGIAEPHDVLAAEEFALPAPPHHDAAAARRRTARGRAGAVIGAAALFALVRRRRSR